MQSIRTKAHHILDIVLDTLFEADLFSDCQDCGGTVNDMAAAHIYPHAFLACSGHVMCETDLEIVRDGVDVAVEILTENVEDIEVDPEDAEFFTRELFARLLAYHRYENGEPEEWDLVPSTSAPRVVDPAAN